MNLINFNVQNLYNNRQVKITWDADTDSTVTNYRVYRSVVPYFTENYTLITTVNASTLEYTDTMPSLLPYGEYYWYVVSYNGAEGVRPIYGQTYINKEAMSEDPFTDQTPYFYFDNTDMEFYFEEIRRRNLALLEQDGETVKLLKRKWTGTKCPLCSDEASGQCPNPYGKPIGTNACYGTGILGGYYESLDIKVRIVNAPSMINLRNEGLRTNQNPRMWTIYSPQITTGDYICTQENFRYEVKSVMNTKQRGMTLHIEFDTEYKFPNDIIYKVPV